MPVIDASDIGLKPGEWPIDLRHDGATWRLVRREDVVRDADGDVLMVRYRRVGTRAEATPPADGDVLVVVND